MATSSSTSAERKATRSVRIVVSACAVAIRRTVSAWAAALPNSFSVPSPATTSRKWPPTADSSAHCRRVRSLVCAPTSAANTGISGSVTRIVSAAVRSANASRSSTASGTTAATASCGRYPARYGSTASTPLVTRVLTAPARSPRRATASRSTRSRSRAFTVAAVRWVSTRCPHSTAARAPTTPARSAIPSPPLANRASSSACASTSTAVATATTASRTP